MPDVNRLLLESVQPNGRGGRLVGVVVFLALAGLALWFV